MPGDSGCASIAPGTQARRTDREAGGRPQRERELPPARHDRPRRQDIVAAAGDLLSDRRIDQTRRAHTDTAAGIEVREAAIRGAVVRFGDGEQPPHGVRQRRTRCLW